jgi:CRISPR-associated protein Cas2
MPMTVVVTRDVAARFRGFLASCMLEIEPGVYTAPDMSAAVRGRALRVLQEWFGELGGGSIIMVWRDRQTVSGQGLVILGTPPMDLVDHEGLILVRRAIANPPPPRSS